MSFEAKEKSVDKLLNDAIYYIPRNQRRYVWGKQNWEDLFEDILLVVEGVASTHFIGSVVLKDEGKEDGLSKYTVIDGQQRIVTLTIFLTAIMFKLKKMNLMNDFGGTTKYLVARDIKNKYREIVCHEYHTSLTKIINAVIDTSQEEMENKSINAFSNMCTVQSNRDTPIEAFKFFANKLEAMDKSTILLIRDALIGIGYVNIISSTEEDSYTIFEILNARGMDLEDHELLKNYIMRYLQPYDRRDEAKSMWEEVERTLDVSIKDFFRHYAIHKINYNNDKKQKISIYKSFQNTYRGRDMDKLLDDIVQKSKYYNIILNPTNDNSVEYKVFTFFKAKRVVQFRPLLLSLMKCRSLEYISDDKYKETLLFLYYFFICYKIIGQENSNILSDTIYKYSYLLEKSFKNETLDDCLCSLKNKLPTLASFINSFKNLGWSNHWGIYQDSKNKERCQLVLTLLEEYISQRELNIPVTIEHILPDSDCIENAQIGNLFFIEEPLNRRCGTKPLEEKYLIYEESILNCPKGFVSRYKEKTFKPEARTEFLAKLVFNNILSIPNYN